MPINYFKTFGGFENALDNNEYNAAILMDLSKAFDYLPYNILLCKLSSYGLTENATKLMESHLSNRKEQIRIGYFVSSWAEIKKASLKFQF